MQLNSLSKIVTKPAKRLGRGLSSGKGKTSGRGTKGQKSRSGYNLPRRFEGGQTALIARLPKAKGFRARMLKPQTVDITRVEAKFNANDLVNLKTLKEKGIIRSTNVAVKIVGLNLTKNLKFNDVVLTKKLLAAYKSKLAQSSTKTETKPEIKTTPKIKSTKTVKSKPEA